MARITVEEPDYRKLLMWLIVLAVGGGYSIYLFWSWWSYPPAVEFDNLKYIQLLRTAVSSQRPDWVAKVKTAIDLRVKEGAMSALERSHFEHVIDLAEAQEWEESNAACFRFEEAQLNRRRSSPVHADAQHEH